MMYSCVSCNNASIPTAAESSVVSIHQVGLGNRPSGRVGQGIGYCLMMYTKHSNSNSNSNVYDTKGRQLFINSFILFYEQ